MSHLIDENVDMKDPDDPTKRRKVDPRDELILARKNFKIFCGGLRYSMLEEDIRPLFQKYGKVVSVIIPILRDGKRPGYAYILMENRADGEAAIRGLNGIEVRGRPLSVSRYMESKEERDEYYSHKDDKYQKYDYPPTYDHRERDIYDYSRQPRPPMSGNRNYDHHPRRDEKFDFERMRY